MIVTRHCDAMLNGIGGKLRNAEPRTKHRALVGAPARAYLLEPVIEGGNVLAAHAEGARLYLVGHVPQPRGRNGLSLVTLQKLRPRIGQSAGAAPDPP